MSGNSTTKSTTYKSLSFLGFPYHRVGDDGSLWSRKNNRWGGTNKWKRLSSFRQKNGYIEGVGQIHIHRLVLLSFIGPCPPGLEYRHLNGKPWDNRLVNLKWGTPQEQADDRQRHGTVLKGEKAPRAKLKASWIPDIIKRYNAGESVGKIAKFYGIGPGAIGDVLHRRSYKDEQPKEVAKIRPNAKLRGHYEEIARSYKNGQTQVSLAKKYGVSQAAISNVLRNIVKI